MTVVVSDTSPLNYLIIIQAADLLPRLFREVLIPPAVERELTRSKTPPPVQVWMASPPEWLRIKAPISKRHSFNLDDGEAEAILLAQELGIRAVLIDERRGFRVAESLGLEPIGLLGILELCASLGWISFDEHIARLRLTSFRFNEALIAEARARLISGGE